MEKIAFIIGEVFVYWSSLILLLAVVCSICLFLGLFLRQKKNGIAAAILIPFAMALSLVISRAAHWYSCANAYEGLKMALTNFTGGGYALYGVFAGCILAAFLLRLLGIIRSLPFAFDCMALAGAGGIAVGRLACLFTNGDRGQVVDASLSFPWAYSVTNAVTGAVEWRLATFMLQAMVTGLIFVGLLAYYLLRERKIKDGDIACLFLCMYGAAQILLDSTRYDSLFLRSNGFISIVQILCAVALVGTIVHFSIRLVKNRGFRWWYVALWVAYAACVGVAGYMEYWVQRHGDQALFSYAVMGACLLGLVVITCVIRALAPLKRRRKKMVENTNI